MKIKLDPGAIMPTRAHSDDAGLDLYAPEGTDVEVFLRRTIDIGVHVEIPKGYVGLIKSRSGLNRNHGVVCEGVIDAGYTGSIGVTLYNHSDEVFHVRAGDRIAQLLLVPIITPELEPVDELDDTERGNKGFGSTGK